MLSATASLSPSVGERRLLQGKARGRNIFISLGVGCVIFFGAVAFLNNPEDPRGCDDYDSHSALIMSQPPTSDVRDFCVQDAILGGEYRWVDPMSQRGSRVQIDIAPGGKVVLRP